MDSNCFHSRNSIKMSNFSNHSSSIIHIFAVQPNVQYVPNTPILAKICLNAQLSFLVIAISCSWQKGSSSPCKVQTWYFFHTFFQPWKVVIVRMHGNQHNSSWTQPLFCGEDKTLNFQQSPFKPTGNEYLILNRWVEYHSYCGMIFLKKSRNKWKKEEGRVNCTYVERNT